MVNKILTCFDFGNYTTLVEALVPHFKEVRYYCEHTQSFPRSNVAQVGKGIEGVIWLDSFWDAVPDTDIFFFPDINSGDLQTYLREQGKLVFGSGKGDEMEKYRYESNELLGDAGLPKVKMHRCYGIDSLRQFLKEHDEMYIKTGYRGDFETWHHETYQMSEPMLDMLENELGIFKKDYEFICCYPIDGEDICEVGTDSLFVDGQLPQKFMSGLEIKDLGYVAAIKDRKDMSPILTEPLDKISPIFKEYQYRNFFSTEIRVGKDRKPYLTDITSRCGSPPSELFFIMIDNLGEVMWEGAQGNLVEPEYNAKYGVQAIITSDWAEKHWQPIYFPDEIKDFVKIKNLTVINGTKYYVPINDVEMSQIGSVVATGNTMEEAIEKIKGYADQVKGFCVRCNVGSIDKAMEEMEKCKKIGITF